MKTNRKLLASLLVLVVLLLGANLVEPVRGAAPLAYGTYTPTPTRTRTPTVSPTPAKLDFTHANSSSIPPDEVLAEMSFFQGGGCFECGPCDPNLQRVQPARALMVPVVLRVCWPQAEEWITFTVYRPDGRSESKGLQVHSGEVEFSYQPLYDYPAGDYRLRLESSRTAREFLVNFTAPAAARILRVPHSPFLPEYAFVPQYNNLVLDHFVAGERVRLYAFRYRIADGELNLLAWQEFSMRGDGRMPVSMDLPDLQGSDTVLFAALGERSGEVHYQQVIGNNFLDDPIKNRTLFCPGAKASRLGTGENALVAHTDGTRLRIHQDPGFSSRTIALVPEGTVVKLVSTPRCADRSWFWPIQWEDVTGWAAEADQQDYLLAPWMMRVIGTLRPLRIPTFSPSGP